MTNANPQEWSCPVRGEGCNTAADTNTDTGASVHSTRYLHAVSDPLAEMLLTSHRHQVPMRPVPARGGA